jgi:hypothetical protein
MTPVSISSMKVSHRPPGSGTLAARRQKKNSAMSGPVLFDRPLLVLAGASLAPGENAKENNDEQEHDLPVVQP